MDRLKIKPNMKFNHLLLFTLFLLLTVGDALEFPRKGYRFPLKRNIHEGLMQSSQGPSEDLVPMAQSYFITPEAPSTTTIKPTFKRRSTNQPISATWDDKSKKKTEQQSPLEIDTSTNNYNKPLRPSVESGFQPKKSFSNKKRRPSSSSSIDMMRRDQNVNEGGAAGPIRIESTSTNTNYQNKETGNASGIGNKKFGGRRKPKKMLDYAGISPSSSTYAKIPSPRPTRFGGHRRNSPAAAFVVKNGTEEVQGSTSESPASASSTSSRPARGSFSRSGRQFGRGPTVEPVEIQPQLAITENQPLRRRKKFTSTTSSSNSNLGSVANDAVVDQVGGVGAAPSVQDPELQKINANVFASRRPFPGINRFATPSTLINPVENAQVLQDNTQINRNRRMRGPRPVQKTLPTPLDSEHQSSSDTITILAESGDIPQQSSPSDLQTEAAPSSENAPPVPPTLPGSRNLSNRKPNPLDKLNNRQAAARRFLTPKKPTEDGEVGTSPSGPTTKAPPLQTTPRAARKSPLSLANLRNRRIGGGSTTTTTEAPVVSNADPQSHEVLGNLEALTGDGVVVNVNGSDPKISNNTGVGAATGGEESPKKEEETEEKPVEEEPKSPLAGLLKNRRPPLRRPLPGAKSVGLPTSSINIPIKPRGPLKPKPTVATTEAPLNVETTTQPTCEDGKRYNKILRKCIPAFKSG